MIQNITNFKNRKIEPMYNPKRKSRSLIENQCSVSELQSRFSNTNPIVLMLQNHYNWYAVPFSINYRWSFGSLAGIFFALQIITGIFLAMHYTGHTSLAFASVDRIMVDVKNGYLFRYMHSNGASMIFILLYLHIGRSLYYQSYVSKPYLWYSGLVIFLLMMATAFIGYVLPWGQMSFWGATVITSLVTAIPVIGKDIAYWIWGGFSIDNPTLTRFYSIHYLLPFLLTAIIFLHLVFLHLEGSSNPTGVESGPGKITFHPYFTYKDATILLFTFLCFFVLVFFFPNYLGHTDNFIPANPLSTPAHIVPEWYFTPFYAILRAYPTKAGGAILMLLSILMLFLLPTIHRIFATNSLILIPYSNFSKTIFWLWVANFFMLMFLGSNPAAQPYISMSEIHTFGYFVYILSILPFTLFIEDSTI